MNLKAAEISQLSRVPQSSTVSWLMQAANNKQIIKAAKISQLSRMPKITEVSKWPKYLGHRV